MRKVKNFLDTHKRNMAKLARYGTQPRLHKTKVWLASYDLRQLTAA